MRKTILFLFIQIVFGCSLVFAAFDPPKIAIKLSTTAQAIAYLDSIGSFSKSTIWPNIQPDLFYKNLRLNVEKPLSFYPGQNTNFCGYGAVSYLVINEDPLGYVRFMSELYNQGNSVFNGIKFNPSNAVKKAAGKLIFKGVLDVRDAEQMWFLVLADHYKGYLNFFNKKYNDGDENTFWAATNLAKYNRMIDELCHLKTTSIGSDLLRPGLKSSFDYLSKRIGKGDIITLYINTRVIRRKNNTKVRMGIPTHFVILEDIYKVNDRIHVIFWDYGGKTLIEVSDRTLRKMIYGISTSSNPNE